MKNDQPAQNCPALRSPLMSEEQAAEYLDISAMTLRRIRRAGKIKYVPVSPRRIRYTQQQLDDYISSQATICSLTESPQPMVSRRSSPFKGASSEDRSANFLLAQHLLNAAKSGGAQS